MKVLFIAAEAAPFGKVGGLADVVGSLPLALEKRGIDVRVIMPLYRLIEDDPRWSLTQTLDSFDVVMNQVWTQRAWFKETEYRGVPFGFIGTNQWFTQAVDSETLYQPGGMQHLFLCEAALEVLRRVDWIPDVIHCHDWQTGFLPVLMREKHKGWDRTATVYSIHNLAYQGEFGIEVLDALHLPRKLFTYEKLETWGRVNFLKAGAIYADHVNTVSAKYAEEIQTPEFGCTLEGVMRHLKVEGKLSGILNGLDTEFFNPATDPHIPANFDLQNLAGKAECKTSLLREVGLPAIEGAPLAGMVSRLSKQKGFDLVVEAAEKLFQLPMQLVVLGVGDPAVALPLRELERAYPEHVKLIEQFDVGLAQRIYAGSDAFLMPSAFEPCGLGQMIAMRYGTLPVVRETGGLADTVFEGANGFTFGAKTAEGLTSACNRMVQAYRDSPQWLALTNRAMGDDFSWDHSAEKYVDLYAKALARRPNRAPVPA